MVDISVISMEELPASLETIDGKLCFICQQTGKDDLKDPMAKKGSSSLLHKQILDFCSCICVKSLIIWSFQSQCQWLYPSHVSKDCAILIWMLNIDRITEIFCAYIKINFIFIEAICMKCYSLVTRSGQFRFSVPVQFQIFPTISDYRQSDTDLGPIIAVARNSEVKSPFWMYLNFHAVARRISPRKKILHSGSHTSKGFQPLFQVLIQWKVHTGAQHCIWKNSSK